MNTEMDERRSSSVHVWTAIGIIATALLATAGFAYQHAEQAAAATRFEAKQDNEALARAVTEAIQGLREELHSDITSVGLDIRQIRERIDRLGERPKR